MKKTITVKLNGSVFNIDEDAYFALEKYLESIKRHYGAAEGEEIMADIESGIAEKLGGLSGKRTKSITLAEIKEVIRIMGTVEEIDSETGTAPEEITAPETENKDGEKRHRLYRDPDDVIIAGVCSGIAAFFGIDSVIVRLVFVALIFAQGMGVLIYIILWIVMPEAKSNVQKLEMRGKPVNLKKIEEVVKEKTSVASEKGREAISAISSNKDIWRKILNFPVRIIEVFVRFCKKILRLIGPIIRVLFGAALVASILAGVLGLIIAAEVMMFGINSSYVVSDLPLAEIASNKMYYGGVVSIFFAILIPLIFLALLGWTILRKRNAFHALPIAILAAIWVVSLVSTVAVAIELSPRFNSLAKEMQRVETVSRNYDYKDFNKIYVGGDLDLKIAAGDHFSINLNGRDKDIDLLDFKIEDGQLQITQKDRNEKGKICIFCFNKEISGEIVMPELDSFVGINSSQVNISGFDKDIYISLGESADADFEFYGQNVECSLSGAGSNLVINGELNNLKCTLDGSARLNSKKITINTAVIKQGTFSRVNLIGEAKALQAEINSHSRLSAYNLRVNKLAINTSGYAEAEVYPLDSIKAVANDSSEISYKGEPKEKSLQEEDYGQINKVNIAELDGINAGELKIKAEPERYSPAMSSVRGITFTPELEEEEKPQFTIFRWTTNEGTLVADWNAFIGNVKEIETDGRVYWTIGFDDNKENEDPIYIKLEAKNNNGEIERSQVKLIDEGNGTYRVVK